MKKIVVLLMALCFCLCGCNETENESVPAVVINQPQDLTVNGYRTQSSIDAYIEDLAPSKQLIGNKNSKVFHDSECSSIKKTKEENKVYFNSREEFINNGFKPCSRCNP